MNREELLRALRRLAPQTGSLCCLGCGHEHNCSLHGCAVIREAVETLEEMSNIPLTLEELLGLEWWSTVWVISGAIVECRTTCFINEGGYEGFIRFVEGPVESIADYGKTWLAYRRRPEEAQEKDNEHTPQKETCGITGHPCCHCNPGPCNSRRTGEEK